MEVAGQKRKEREDQPVGQTMLEQKGAPTKARRMEEPYPGMEVPLYTTNPMFLVSLVHTRAEQLRVPENKVFVAERTDKVVDVFKGLIRHNFLSVPVLQKTGHKWYGFLDMGDIVAYICEHFGRDKLQSSEDFWELVSKEEEFNKLTVNDVMKYPLSRRNPFHPVKRGYSLLYAIEPLAREYTLHRVPVIDEDRNLMNLITQSQVVDFLYQNIDAIGSKMNKPVGEVSGAIKDVICIKESQHAIDAFTLMVRENVTGVGVINDDGKLVDNISLRDLKTMAPDGRLFWRLYQTTHNFLRHLREDHQLRHQRPRSVQACAVNDPLAHVIGLLSEHKIHRVFIVDADRKPIGVIALKDVLLEIIA